METSVHWLLGNPSAVSRKLARLHAAERHEAEKILLDWAANHSLSTGMRLMVLNTLAAARCESARALFRRYIACKYPPGIRLAAMRGIESLMDRNRKAVRILREVWYKESDPALKEQAKQTLAALGVAVH